MVPDALDRAGWGGTVVVRPDEAVLRALLERQREGTREGSVSVTEVLEPRSAYWRRLHPVPPPPDRAAKMHAGQEMHVLVGHLLAPTSEREVRRRRGGIVARIDLLGERVTELKTTGLRSTAEGPSAVRPGYLQQLAVYCGMLERPDARLILVDPGSAGPPRVEAYDLDFPEPRAGWDEATRRATLLRSAVALGSPGALPACSWRDRGCEFQAAGVCDCPESGASGPAVPIDPFGPVPPLRRNAELAGRLAEALAQQPDTPPIRRFRDLLYPRRAYFERVAPVPEGAANAWTPPAGGTEDLWRTVSDLVDTGAAGEVAARDPPSGEPLERVTTLEGRPLLIKGTRSRYPTPPERVLAVQPQYILELGLRCAAVGATEGTLIVAYERVDAWERRLVVTRVRFEPAETIVGVADDRTHALHEALETRDPARLPKCPTWMADGCPYAAVCGCGPGASPATQR